MSVAEALLHLRAEFEVAGVACPQVHLMIGDREMDALKDKLAGLLSPQPDGSFQALGFTYSASPKPAPVSPAFTKEN